MSVYCGIMCEQGEGKTCADIKLLLLKSIKGAAKFNVPIRWMNSHQQKYAFTTNALWGNL